MKVTVIEIFQDKITNEHHQIGDVIDIKDSKRLEALVDKKLVEVTEPIKAPKKSTKKPVED